MKHLLFTALVLTALICGCGEQEKADGRLLYNKEFDWTMTIPEGFDSMTKEEVDRIQGRGVKAMEDTYDMDFEERGATLFAFRSNQTTFFHSNWQPFDTAKDGNYGEGFYLLNKMIYGTFKAQLPVASLDSSSSTETISGLDFLVFRVKVGEAGDTTECLYYRRLFGKKEFLVNIASTNKQEQAAMLEAWRKSKFGAGNR